MGSACLLVVADDAYLARVMSPGFVCAHWAVLIIVRFCRGTLHR